MEKNRLTMGSLFDGIGGFPLAAVRNGITPVWASEIESFPIRVTQKHFPDMVHVGDITKLDGSKLPPVDIICGGSPCQDVSLAGTRKGLTGERSGLFFEQIRIISEMREADKKRGRTGIAVRPRLAVWENVLGSYSSGTPHGSDFQAVLEAFLNIEEPHLHVVEPPGGRWEYAGAVLGEKSCVAWVTWNSKHLGVPQERRRIFLVTDFGGCRSIQVLFVPKSLPGYPAQEQGAGQAPAGCAGMGSVGPSGVNPALRGHA